MKFHNNFLATAALFALSASCTLASTFYLNPGANLDAPGAKTDTNTRTGELSFINLNPNATSIYTQIAGQTATVGKLTDGDVLNIVDNGVVHIGSFNNSTHTTDKFETSFEGFGDSWRLRVEYSVSGTAVVSGLGAGVQIDMTNIANQESFSVGGIIPSFDNTGRFNIYIDDIGDNDVPELSNQKVLQLNLDPYTALTPANLELKGTVDYAWLAGSGYSAAQTSAIENFFRLTNGTSFYENWANNKPVTWKLQTNTEPNLIPRNNVAPNGNVGKSNVKSGLNQDVSCAINTFCRTTSLNMDIQFDVPEPELALMLGLGILGLGFTSAKRHKTTSAV